MHFFFLFIPAFVPLVLVKYVHLIRAFFYQLARVAVTGSQTTRECVWTLVGMLYVRVSGRQAGRQAVVMGRPIDSALRVPVCVQLLVSKAA